MADKIFLGTYDPKRVSVIVNGLTMTGVAEGTFVKVERLDPETYKTHVGAHGEVGRTKNPNRAGKVTLTLKGSSPSNIILSAFKNLTAPIAIAIMDNSDLKYGAVATNGWISNNPAVEFAMDETNREWIFTVDELNDSFL